MLITITELNACLSTDLPAGWTATTYHYFTPGMVGSNTMADHLCQMFGYTSYAAAYGGDACAGGGGDPNLGGANPTHFPCNGGSGSPGHSGSWGNNQANGDCAGGCGTSNHAGFTCNRGSVFTMALPNGGDQTFTAPAAGCSATIKAWGAGGGYGSNGGGGGYASGTFTLASLQVITVKVGARGQHLGNAGMVSACESSFSGGNGPSSGSVSNSKPDYLSGSCSDTNGGSGGGSAEVVAADGTVLLVAGGGGGGRAWSTGSSGGNGRGSDSSGATEYGGGGGGGRSAGSGTNGGYGGSSYVASTAANPQMIAADAAVGDGSGGSRAPANADDIDYVAHVAGLSSTVDHPGNGASGFGTTELGGNALVVVIC